MVCGIRVLVESQFIDTFAYDLCDDGIDSDLNSFGLNSSPNSKKNYFRFVDTQEKENNKWYKVKIHESVKRNASFFIIYGFVYIDALLSFAPIFIWLFNASPPFVGNTVLHFKQQQYNWRAYVWIFAAELNSVRIRLKCHSYSSSNN